MARLGVEDLSRDCREHFERACPGCRLIALLTLEDTRRMAWALRSTKRCARIDLELALDHRIGRDDEFEYLCPLLAPDVLVVDDWWFLLSEPSRYIVPSSFATNGVAIADHSLARARPDIRADRVVLPHNLRAMLVDADAAPLTELARFGAREAFRG